RNVDLRAHARRHGRPLDTPHHHRARRSAEPDLPCPRESDDLARRHDRAVPQRPWAEIRTGNRRDISIRAKGRGQRAKGRKGKKEEAKGKAATAAGTARTPSFFP